VRKIGKGGSLELGKRVVPEAHCADALGNGWLGDVHPVERVQDRGSGCGATGFIRALIFEAIIPILVLESL